ncbi:hypothetical protein J3R82DRAFT_9872 [Butyriboletus roseoflavus]|nr:hypothetical protein J3R82DRAFT_9872 [Butyriboletus roseoflavus]
MAYEKLMWWSFEQKQKQFAKAGKTIMPEDSKLICITYPDVHSLIHLHCHTVEHSLYSHIG